MTKEMNLGGSFALPDSSMTVNRMGYGAMQLAGPEVWGPPRDVDGAIAVLREAVAASVNHIDTALDAAPARLQTTPMKIALAWLHQRAHHRHLRENLDAATLHLPSAVIAD